jgi:hypothetical protein
VHTPEFESSALANPLQMIGLVPLAAVAWYVPRHIRKNAIEIEKELLFEEAPSRVVEVLHLID